LGKEKNKKGERGRKNWEGVVGGVDEEERWHKEKRGQG
jgi:hypothetical protein